jgi:hypothetical protein
MKTASSTLILNIAASALLLPSSAFAKDIPMSLDRCPGAVQTVVKQYSTRATFEEIALDMKKKSGGPAVYEAKFSLPDGKRIELHITTEGKILQIENKKSKN